MDGEPEDFGPFDMGTGLQMPDFSSIGRTMRMISWVPAILTCVSMTTMTFLVLVIYNGLVQGDYNITYGSFMMIILLSFAVGMITGGLVKMTTGRRAKKMAFSF